MRCRKLIELLAILVAVGCPGAFADSITPTGTSTFSQGTGFGNVLSILGLHPGGNVTSAWGGVLWDGSADVRSGDAQSGAQTATRTVQELLDVGATASDWSVIFNVNQTGGTNPPVFMPTFTLTFWNAGGGSLGSLTYTEVGPPFEYSVAGQGQGSSGYVFNVSLTTLTSVFDNPTNRIGMFVPENNPLTGTIDGPENFYVGPGEGSLIPPIPEPTSLLLLGTGLGALGLVAYRRRKK